MAIALANTALTPATLNHAITKVVTVMNSNYRDNIECYLSAMHHADKLLFMKVITPIEHAKIDTIMASKYNLTSCSIYRPNSLINSHFSGNMSYYKEGDYE